MKRRKLITVLTGVTYSTFAGCVGIGLSDGSESDSSNTPEKNEVPVGNLDNDEEPKLGLDDAPVSILYWGDFNCGYCYKFAQQTFPKIRENFVSSGDVRIIYKNYIAKGEDSFKLAKASQAAWKLVGGKSPEKYWEWHKELSADQPRRKDSSQSALENVKYTTGKIEGISRERLVEKMKTVDNQEIEDDTQEGEERGIPGTPSFVVYNTGSNHGTRIIGAKPYEDFKSEISRRLKS